MKINGKKPIKSKLSLKQVDKRESYVVEKSGKIHGRLQTKTYQINGWEGSNIEILSYVNTKGVTLEMNMFLSKDHSSLISMIDLDRVEKLFKVQPNQYLLSRKYKSN